MSAAITWRDIADQLTPDQVEKLTTLESTSRSPADEVAEGLLEAARETAAANVVNSVIFGDVERPSDARRFCVFSDEMVEDGVWTRSFDGTQRKVADVEVYISGLQYADGRVERTIGIEARDEYDSETARRLAAALLEAADEVDRLSA
ncbi:conserved hypothetical protein [uncultured Mycobacterium sp.]|uniref:Uncharacterized protein n=1 Tax=uncultured Mycobacterium sp. TaxID=171292 RepID=A0A1Y5PKT4_9MYCO|nr:conserved hypothetical protein [uncultured Mycobacterium sp.]